MLEFEFEFRDMSFRLFTDEGVQYSIQLCAKGQIEVCAAAAVVLPYFDYEHISHISLSD